MLSRFLSRINISQIRPWWLVGAIFVLFLLAGCSRSADKPAVDPQLARQIELGGQVYAANCAACHGPEGEGQPDWKTPKEDGTYPAPPHDVSGHTWHHGDGTLLQIIRGGGDSLDIPNFKSAMPPFEDTLDHEEIVAVLAYLKSRWPEEERHFQAEMTQKDPAP